MIPLLLPDVETTALEHWFEEEPLAVPVQLTATGLSEALPAILAALDGSQRPGFRAYNVTRDAPPLLTQREYFATFAAALGRRPRFVPVPIPAVRAGIAIWTVLLRLLRPSRYAGVGGSAISFLLGENPFLIDGIRNELGWAPPFDTRTAIARAVG